MEKKVRIIASLLAFSLVSNFSIVYASNVNDLRNEVSINQTELDNVMRELGEMESKIQQTNNKIEIALDEVKVTDSKIVDVEGNIEKTDRDLSKAREDKLDKEEEYGDRLVEIYKRGKFDYLTYIFSTNKVEDIVTRFELAQKVMRYDQSVIEEMKKIQDKISETMDELVKQKDDLNNLRSEKQNTVNELDNLKVEYEDKQNELNEKKDQYKNEIAELNRQIEELTRPIIIRPQPIADNNTYDARANTYNNVAAANTTQQLSRGDYGGSSDIASFAARYIGVPYVWGGSSPAGFDCSGFAQYCYLNAAGISIPRIASDQQNSGYAVSSPASGDLVFFGYPAYHVGIYVGNDTIIHSPTSGDVVKYSKLSYMSGYSGARRYR